MRVFLCALLGVLPLPLAAQRVEVVLDSVRGPRAEVAAAKSELGLRHGLAATPGVHVLPLRTSHTQDDTHARYRIVGSVVADTGRCTLSVQIVDRRTGRTVDHAQIRAAWEALSDSASALGERIGRQLVVGKRATRPAIQRGAEAGKTTLW